MAYGVNQLPAGLVVIGPTAAGKSRLAMALARRWRGAIINADAIQSYRELSILTDRPDQAEEKLLPHYLYGTRAAGRPGSAASWAEDARAAIQESLRLGWMPILVGGSGLYLRALFSGLARFPDIAPETRNRARTMEATLGVAELWRWLMDRDAATARRLVCTDRQRIMRAVEVWLATGRGMAAWHQDARSHHVAPMVRWFVIALLPDRVVLRKRVQARLSRMVERGALDEVATLMAMRLDPGLPVVKAVGVRELTGVIEGWSGYDEGVSAMLTATMRYAKRQASWIRNQTERDIPIGLRLDGVNPGMVDGPGVMAKIEERGKRWLSS